MKDLLITTETFFPKTDGVTTFLSELLPRFAKNYRVTLLAPSYSRKVVHETYKGVKVIRLPTLPLSVSGYPAIQPKMKIITHELEHADVVFVNSMGPLGIATTLRAKKLNKRVVSFIHSIEHEQLSHVLFKNQFFQQMTEKLVSKLARLLYNKCDTIIVPSHVSQKRLESIGINTEMTIIHLGCNTDTFRQRSKLKARKELSIDNDAFVVGYVGRISKEKDIATLLEAIRMVRKTREDTRLIIVGNGGEIPSEKHIHVTGFVADVTPYLAAMDVYVLPSLTETTSLATLEAMASGLAVITTPVGYVKNYVTNGANGLTFPFRNPLVLKKKILQLTDQKLRKKLGTNARKTIVNHFSWDQTYKKICDVI